MGRRPTPKHETTFTGHERTQAQDVPRRRRWRSLGQKLRFLHEARWAGHGCPDPAFHIRRNVTAHLDVSCVGQRAPPIHCNLLRYLAAGETEMLDPSANRILARSLQAGLLGWTLSLAIMTQVSAADALPASVRACTAETDRERRLDCFDRAVARFSDAKATSQAARTLPAASASAPPTTTSAALAPPAAPAATSIPSTNAASGAAAAPAARPGQVAARVVSIDRAPNEMVLHLDNGQVWEEEQSVTGDLSLKAGDSVTIVKRLGSYWLTGPHVSGMKVREKS